MEGNHDLIIPVLLYRCFQLTSIVKLFCRYRLWCRKTNTIIDDLVEWLSVLLFPCTMAKCTSMPNDCIKALSATAITESPSLVRSQWAYWKHRKAEDSLFEWSGIPIRATLRVPLKICLNVDCRISCCFKITSAHPSVDQSWFLLAEERDSKLVILLSGANGIK